MKLPKELRDFLKGTDIKNRPQEPPDQITSRATPRGLENYNVRPTIVQSGSGRRGEMIDQTVLDIQETDAFKRLPVHEQRRLLRTMVATSVRTDTQHGKASTNAEARKLKQQAVEKTRDEVGVSGLQKLINRIRNL